MLDKSSYFPERFVYLIPLFRGQERERAKPRSSRDITIYRGTGGGDTVIRVSEFATAHCTYFKLPQHYNAPHPRVPQ